MFTIYSVFGNDLRAWCSGFPYFSILSSPPHFRVNQSSIQRHGLVSILRGGEKENGNVPVTVVNPKWSIAARLAKLRTGLIIYLTAMLIAERQSPPLIISPVHVTVLPSKRRHSKVMGLIRFSRPTIR